MGDVGAEIAGSAQTDLGVHVGTVHVDLASVIVDHLADLDHLLFENAVGRRIGYHEARQSILVLFGLPWIQSMKRSVEIDYFFKFQKSKKSTKKVKKSKKKVKKSKKKVRKSWKKVNFLNFFLKKVRKKWKKKYKSNKKVKKK